VPRRVTVATNMAGRGTDIILHPAVREAEVSASSSRSSMSRGASTGSCSGVPDGQGDPGSYEHRLARGRAVSDLRRPAQAAARKTVVPSTIARLLRWRAQGAAERLHARIRRRTLESDRHLARSLAFSGRGE
jgi:preprotein translocase subunit SecA